MHIGLVGGLERNGATYEELAAREGHTVERHRGPLGGRGSRALEALVARSDVVIVVTDMNSHGAVWRVRRLTRSGAPPWLLMSRCGVSRFVEVLKQLRATMKRGLGRLVLDKGSEGFV
jgi:Uncharacterized protein conserved in bacteria (DUF2325)